MSKKLEQFFFFMSLALIGFGIIWGVVIYFDSWDKITSDQSKFELFRFPIITIFVGCLLESYKNMLRSEQ